MTTLRERAPYVVVMSMGGALLGLSAWYASSTHATALAVIFWVSALVMLGTAALLALLPLRWIPVWVSNFQLAGAEPSVVLLRCTRCQVSHVFPLSRPVPLVRFLSHGHLHATVGCRPAPAMVPPDGTGGKPS